MKYIGTYNVIAKDAVLTLHPELVEGEDERIRKAISVAICGTTAEKILEANGVKLVDALAYLEKQKEQPPDAKLERVIKAARRVLNIWLDGTDCPDVSGDFAELEYAILEYDDDGKEKQKEQKPAEWSEEDSKGKFVFPKFLYARTTDNKTIDVSYVPQSIDAIEYVRNNFAEGSVGGGFSRETYQEFLCGKQPEADLKKELDEYCGNRSARPVPDFIEAVAHHFYGLRNRALEEAARAVYESWMGGTMDDVRRDMVELGRVLNARKEASV